MPSENNSKPDISGFDWQKSPAHVAFLGTFYKPRSTDEHPTQTKWDHVLGEPHEKAFARFLEEKVLVYCGISEMLEHELPKFTNARLKDLLRERDLPFRSKANKDELVQLLINSREPILNYDIPNRNVFKCSDQGRDIVDNFIENSMEGLEKADRQTLIAVKNVLLWLLEKGLGGLVDTAKLALVQKLINEVEQFIQSTPQPAIESTPLPSPAPLPELAGIQTPPPEKTSKTEPAKPRSASTARIFEPELVNIPAGYFWMGSDDKDRQAYDDEKPKHRLYLPEYWIGRYPITVAQFSEYIKYSGYTTTNEREKRGFTWKSPRGRASSVQGKENHPVTQISWYDVMEYCEWLSKITGKRYTLPSEPEWEKAARGTDGRKYPWGNRWDKNKCNNAESNINDTTPVGCDSPRGDSPYGCTDMAGNVWEWMRSLYIDYPYDSEDGREALNAPENIRRVVRGGAFYDDRRNARCAVRSRNNPGLGYDDLGFRVVISPQESFSD